MPFPEHQQFCLIAELNINYTYNERQLLPANAVESGSANKSQRQAVAITSKLARCMHLVASLHSQSITQHSALLCITVPLHNFTKQNKAELASGAEQREVAVRCPLSSLSPLSPLAWKHHLAAALRCACTLCFM